MMSILEIAKDRVFIIAEAGVNHKGDINLAKRLVDRAVEAGADAVKFQAFRTDHLILENTKKAPYQIKTTGNKQTQSEMLKQLELRKENYAELKNYCEERGIMFLVTPFDEVSLNELEEINLQAYKVSSSDTTNLPLLRKIAQNQKPVILSTGMCYLEEVRKAVETVQDINKQLILMQCTANYPIDDSEANLNVLKTYSNEFDCMLGYSDHTVGLGASLFAIPMGARVIEKHFTLDKEAAGPDHKASLSPDELQDFVKEVRRIERFLGSAEKKPTKSELENRRSLQKCLVASQPIKKGEEFSEANLVAKRTGGEGISPIKVDSLYGKKAIVITRLI